MKYECTVALIAMVCVGVGGARGQCTTTTNCGDVEVNLSNLTGSVSCTGNSASGWSVSVANLQACSGGAGSFTVRPTQPGVILSAVTTSFPSSSTDVVYFEVKTVNSNTYSHIGSLTKASTSGYLCLLSAVSSGTIGGSIVLNDIGDIEASQAVSATIESLGGGGFTGDINGVRSSSSSVFGSITAHGAINSVTAGSGTIGSSPTSRATINSHGTITVVSARAIYADISSRYPVDNQPGTGDIKFLRTTAGDFSGSLTTTNVFEPSNLATNRGLDIAGNLDADIYCTSLIKDPIYIDGAILSGRTFTTATNGITKQVIINQDNNNFLWSGAFTVGSTTLSPTPYYDNAPSLLGGGSIGLAPFRIHYEACTPVGAGDPTVIGNCAHHASENNAVSVVQITHYGPVGLHDGNDFVTSGNINGRKGFTVDRAKEGECIWTDLSDTFTTVLVGGNNRTLQVQGDFAQGSCGVNYLYRIRPVVSPSSGRLVVKCRDVDGNPTVGLSEYVLQIVATDCGGWEGN